MKLNIGISRLYSLEGKIIKELSEAFSTPLCFLLFDSNCHFPGRHLIVLKSDLITNYILSKSPHLFEVNLEPCYQFLFIDIYALTNTKKINRN